MLKTNYSILKKTLPHLQRDVFLTDYTTFKIGGRAKYFLAVSSKKELIEAVLVAKKYRLPLLILGGGSNLLISENGWAGLAIKNQAIKIQNLSNGLICGEAGIPLSKIVKISADNSLAGFEWAAGIPGTLGGAIAGNAGAFGSAMENSVKSVEAFDIKKKEIVVFNKKECLFGYRASIFKKNKNLIILSCKLQFKKSESKEIKEKIKAHLAYRHSHHPKEPSAGSVFKNISLFELEKDFFDRFPEAKKTVKEGRLPVAYLIDQAGLKGKIIGRAKVSEIHPNFIINSGRAKSKDVRDLIKAVKKAIKEKFGVRIKEEINFL
jgi:UDP-N-acetylmuramate dehydrogenase